MASLGLVYGFFLLTLLDYFVWTIAIELPRGKILNGSYADIQEYPYHPYLIY